MSFKKDKLAIVLGMVVGGMACVASAQTNRSFNVEGNPLFRDTFNADPAPFVAGDRLYVVTGRDDAHGEQMFNMPEWLCYSTADMKEWTAHGPIMKPADFKWSDGSNKAWASQIVEKDGKFYFYVTVMHDSAQGHSANAIGVAVSDHPTGPFKDARGSALITDEMTPVSRNWGEDIDPTVFVDDDGTPWMSWGNGDCYLVKLKRNMIELDGEIQKVDLPNFTEGPWLHKRGDLYYLTYASCVPGVVPEQIAYATAPKPSGPWTWRGMVTGPALNSFTIHPGIVEFKDQWYFFYHYAGLIINGERGAIGRRAVCVEPLYYNEDGTIKPIEQNTDWVNVVIEKEDKEADWTNPIVPQRADPQVFLHSDGYYYLAATVPSFDRIELRKARTIGGLAKAEPATVWKRPESGSMSGNIWAPELHFIDSKWYLYVSAGDREKSWDSIRPHVIECDGSDPFEGEWKTATRITTKWDSYSLDGTVFVHKGQHYFVWCQVEPGKQGTNIMIAKMKSPTVLDEVQTILSRPEFPWEQKVYWVNEAPSALIKNGKVFITYSASATDENYCMGLLTADADADLLDAASWKKSKEPVFKSNDETSQYGPGHNSFTTTPDGKTVIMVYHSRNYKNVNGNGLDNPDRHTRAQILEWNKDGTPNFGVPVADGAYVISGN